MTLPWEILERDHDLQNPTSPAKIRLLGEYLRLTPQTSVLDVACGKAGPAMILAAEHGCRIRGIELRSGFADAARERIAAAGLERLIEVEAADASAATFEPAAYDVALCLGAGGWNGAIGGRSGANGAARRRRSDGLRRPRGDGRPVRGGRG